MSELPIRGLTREEQQRYMSQMYLLLGKQVKSYHKHRHMGENTSVPMELAQELMRSVEYTLSLTALREPEEALRAGQEILDGRVRQAKRLLELVVATAPRWQSECRWDALRCLEGYFVSYDPLHLAHRIPEGLFYPILIREPEGIAGIDHGLFYLNVMWLENQIMAGVPEQDAEALWDVLSQDVFCVPLNQCELLLINGVGKAVLGPEWSGLTFSRRERDGLCAVLAGKNREELGKILDSGAQRLCRWLGLTDENAVRYAKAVVPQLQPRLEGALTHGDLSGIFL